MNGEWSEPAPVAGAGQWVVRTRRKGDGEIEFEAYESAPGCANAYTTAAGSPTSDVDEADPDVTGRIRWDGCCELSVGNDAAWWHHDEPEELEALVTVLRYCRALHEPL